MISLSNKNLILCLSLSYLCLTLIHRILPCSGVTALDEHFAKWLRKTIGEIDRIASDKVLRIAHAASEKRLRLEAKGVVSEEETVPEVRHCMLPATPT